MNQKTVEIRGIEFTLSERYTADVRSLGSAYERLKGQEIPTLDLSAAMTIISDALRPAYRALPRYALLRRWQYRKAMSVNWLYENLGISEMSEFCRIITEELEGSPVDGQKKKATSQSAMTSPIA